MAGGKGNTYNNMILNMLLGGESPTIPATVYVALFTTTPSDLGGGTEVVATGYSRLSVPNNTTNFPHVTNQIKKNGIDLAFGVVTGAMGTISHIAIMDLSSGGNIIYWGPANPPQTHTAGNTFTIPANGATFTEA